LYSILRAFSLLRLISTSEDGTKCYGTQGAA
jgi:hypothetical protein